MYFFFKSRRTLSNYMVNFSSNLTAPSVIIGDFNANLGMNEKTGSEPINVSCVNFQNTIY